MTFLIRLYPRAWRARYGEELTALVANEAPTMRLVVDLVAGAIDARLNPQALPHRTASVLDEGGTTMRKMIAHCYPSEISPAEQWKSAAWMLGGTVVLSVVYIALRRQFGETLVIDAFGTAVFPITVLFALRNTYFKPYSLAARTVMIVGLMAAVFLIALAAEFVGNRI
jgi:hypothetical protein